MPVPQTSIPTPHRTPRSKLAWLLLLATLPLFARGPEPPLRIPIQDIGFHPSTNEFLLNGSSLFTLHYVDDKHLLLTFVVHRLIPRLPNEPEDDQDRVVEAVLLEIPNGKVLGRTSWHLHDHSQYLWNIGHGHFLLRIRDSLTTFAPMANLSTGQPFTQRPLLDSAQRRLAVIIVSPESDLLVIESVKRKPPTPKSRLPLFDPAPPTEKDRVQINFYRIHASETDDTVQAASAGVVQSPNTGDVPVTTAGYLAVVDQGRPHWAFDFHTYSGKTQELSPFDSTCTPAPIFVSRSEFIAFGCRGGHNMQAIGGFNMRGEEMWEQGLFGDFIAPSIDYAPAGGRFALSRVLLRNSVLSDQPISNDEVSGQAVIVYQTGTGKQLLRADCSPVARAGQNFALAPNGLRLAVIHADAIEIYTLPPLTPKDEATVKLAQTSAPPDTNLPMRFNGRAEPSPDESSISDAANSNAQPTPQPATPQPTTAAPPATATDTAASPTPAESAKPDSQAIKSAAPPASPQPTPADPATPTQTSGDPSATEHRAPPTLYNMPGDKVPNTPQRPTTPQ
jgi:hypothetical protein